MATEKRLIDLDTIKPMNFPSTEMDGLDVVRYLSTLPTVDAVEVVHGRWIPEIDPPNWAKPYETIGGYVCSACGSHNYVKATNYCPNCGAKMDMGKEVGSDA